MRIEWEAKLGYKDVLIRPKRSTLNSRSQVSIERRFVFKHSDYHWTGVPIIAANMDTIGTFLMTESLSKYQMVTAIHKHYSLSAWQNFLHNRSGRFFDHFMVSTGIHENDLHKLENILKEFSSIRYVCVDVANGYTESFVDFLKRLRDNYPDKVLVAGNVVTPEMTEELILSGADLVKIGIGPGSVCTTRVKTGVGFPQLSAVIECADAAHGLGGHVIADGGCNCAGDVAKAFAAGADFVMLGGMFAGHDESNGQIVTKDKKKYVEFYGMSSKQAMEKHSGGLADYRASEGKSTLVPYKGSVEGTVKDILGGVRSACTYVGASSIKELAKRTTFIRVYEQENQVFN
ncbi:MAG: GMP reductase [Zetaproteobacteria bacterium]|nr:GMP reductase [Pseudobdellovibrionaceae bacterium]